MYLRTLLLLLVLGAIAAFAAVNWGAFTTPTSLSLVFTTVQAPLGLIMLGIAAILTALFLVFLVYLQTSVIIEARRHTRELRAQRELAEKAETSRFTELRTFLEAELPKLASQTAEIRTDVQTRLDQLDQNLRSAIEQGGNTLAAYIGELEDRLERGAGEPGSKSSV
jgi:uncharacterized integral membrane protein